MLKSSLTLTRKTVYCILYSSRMVNEHYLVNIDEGFILITLYLNIGDFKVYT